MLASLGIASLVLVILTVAIMLANSASVKERVLTPLLLFCVIEIMAVWLSLLPTFSINGIIQDYFPLLLAVTGLLLMVVAYLLAGGTAISVAKWRGEQCMPTPDTIRRVRQGLFLWTGFLTAVELYRFSGLPPLLTGGLTALINPLENVDQVSAIRETRRELTKGHTVMGEDYAGQGIVNALTATGWQSVAVVAVLISSWTKRRKDVIVAGILMAVAFIFLGSAGSRLPLMLLAMSVTILLSVRHRASLRHIVSLGVGLGVLLLLIIPLSKGAPVGGGIGGRLEAALRRVSQGNGQNNAMIVYLTERGDLPMTWGGLFVERTLASLPGAGAGEDPFALRLTRLAYGAGQNTTGYATPTQFGLMYADGGPFVVILGYALTGLLLALVWRGLSRFNGWYGPVLVAQGSLTLALTSVTGIHGIPPTLLMIAIAIAIINVPVYLQRRPHRKEPLALVRPQARTRIGRS